MAPSAPGNRRFCLFLGLITVLSVSEAFPQTSPDTLKARLQNLLDTNLPVYGMKGAALTVILPDEQTFTLTSGYASAPGDPVDTLRAWHWASATKPLAGYVALKLIEEGALHFDDPIGMYLDTDTIPNVDSAITIKQLLRHTGGLNEVWSQDLVPTLWDAVWSHPDSVWQPRQVLSYIPPPSGLTTHRYASTNTWLLSFIIEEVTGKDLETVFQERIFTPLGMQNSNLSSGKIFDMSKVNGSWKGDENRSTASNTAYLSSRSGNSALISTPMDVAKFYRAFYNDELLSKAIMDSLRIPAAGSRIPFGDIGGIGVTQLYGYETEIFELVQSNGDTTRVFGHGGNGIQNSFCTHWPEKNITIILVQNDFTTDLFTMGTQYADFFKEIAASYPFTSTGVESVDSGADLPVSYALDAAYPNPFNPTTNLEFRIADAGLVKVTVFDVMGRESATLVNEVLTPGAYKTSWEATGMPSGMYFCRLEAQGSDGKTWTQTRKVILLK